MSVLRLPRYQSLWSKSHYEASQILLIRFFQTPNDQCCATGFSWGVSQLLTLFAEMSPIYVEGQSSAPKTTSDHFKRDGSWLSDWRVIISAGIC